MVFHNASNDDYGQAAALLTYSLGSDFEKKLPVWSKPSWPRPLGAKRSWRELLRR